MAPFGKELNMRVALHPQTLNPLDAVAYEKAFGKPIDQYGNKRQRPDALCGVCGQGVYLRAEHSADRVANFAHRRNGQFCPVRDFNAATYRALNPTVIDPNRAANLKSAFFATWKYHWQEFDRIVEYASVYDFCDVLTYANTHGIWNYRGMRVQDVLPVLMTLKDFPPLPKSKRHLRDQGIRFFYHGPVANTGQYWNLPTHERVLVMVRYDFPGTTRTFQEKNVSGRSIVGFDPIYLAGVFDDQPQVHEFVEKQMRLAFPNDVE